MNTGRYVTIATQNGLDLSISKAPSSVLDIALNELYIDLCEDSFHVLMELLSNFLGLDIPLTGVADLIVTEEGIDDQELSGMLGKLFVLKCVSFLHDAQLMLYPNPPQRPHT